ncbi:MAG: glycosyltransferase family 4 protein [Candidatus Moraniibacteriota bacterium]|jgi:phosphatidyl-myo-inositol dimannoside synthase
MSISQKNNLKILFISRAYPPVVGGIENQNYELSQWLPKITPTKTIANTHGKKFLPFFLIRLFATLPFTASKYDVILLGDGVLGIVSWWIKLFNKQTKIACIVHGLDLTYKNTFYQKYWVNKFIPTCDKLIAVGNQTIIEGVARGINKDKFTFIPNGVHPEKFIHDDIDRNEIFNIIGNEYRDKKILLTFGRLARRKGVAWFIRNVLPNLSDDITYIVAGTGPDKENIENAIQENHLQKRVIMMGYVDDATRDKIFAGADLFIQANIKVEGDMEGFGISVIESGVSGIPVLASRLEGLKDAINDGKNGIQVEAENPDDWENKITHALSDDFNRKEFGLTARKYIVENLSWDKVSKLYYTILKSI